MDTNMPGNKFMLRFTQSWRNTYTAIPASEDAKGQHQDTDYSVQHKQQPWFRRSVFWICLVLTFLATVTSLSLYCLHRHVLQINMGAESATHASPSEVTCTDPSVRRAWHQVSKEEQLAYVSAVMCLQTIPSRLGLNHSLYIDFPYTHIWHGHDWHDGVSFFVQHRWFLHIYEMALRDECGYEGSMLYWDWTLDWHDPYAAPVFDPVYGFGGDGNPDKPGFRGGCIDKGPLANTMMPYIQFFTEEHCLSRNFTNLAFDLDFWGEQWRPEKLEAALQLDDLIDFVRRVEYGMHRALPNLIGGHYTTKGSPADPLFFLHHAQLDRIYWMWQQKDPSNRIHDFQGPKTREDERESARLTDVLNYGDLGPMATVQDVLDLQGGRLCYTYV